MEAAEQTKNFLSFILRLSAGGEGGAGKNGKEILGLHARVRERVRGASGWPLEMGSREVSGAAERS